MTYVPPASAIAAAVQAQAETPAKPHRPGGAPIHEIPDPGDALKDALILRNHAQGANPLGAAAKLSKVVDGAAEKDPYLFASSATSLIDDLTPALSRSMIGAGLNVLVVGAGSRTIVSRHKELITSVDELAKKDEWDYNAVFRLTSVTQQIAVFWRTMGNASYKAGTWVLRQGAKIPALAPQAVRATEGVAKIAASPTGKVLGLANKWIPVLNAAWIMMALKTAWDVHHDPQASGTTRAVSLTGVFASCAAVWAGIFASGSAFLIITILSIAADLVLAETRHRDKRFKDTDALALRYVTRPWEGAAATMRWGGRVGKAFGHQLAKVRDALLGKKPEPTKPEPTKPAPKPLAKPAIDPGRRLTVAG